MTKTELLQILAERSNRPHSEIKKIMHFFFEIMKETLIEGEELSIKGLGTFKIKERKTKRIQNIHKMNHLEHLEGEQIIPPQKKLTFKACKSINRLINQSKEKTEE